VLTRISLCQLCRNSVEPTSILIFSKISPEMFTTMFSKRSLVNDNRVLHDASYAKPIDLSFRIKV